VTDGELRDAIREHALLHGDFVLRSGRRSSWYLDKYRFETRPELLRELGVRLVDLARSVEPGLVRLAGPELGAVALSAAASLAGDVPFLIVRREAKGYGTDNRIEGAWAEGELVCLVEDVVTSGGAALEAVRALRAAGLRVANAVCVLDREEGGVDELARHAVRLHALFRGGDLVGA
jgi:orotate phosphoribosyltransferase